jgi:multisubunit Na+/H+ antiporter MnhB subunit
MPLSPGGALAGSVVMAMLLITIYHCHGPEERQKELCGHLIRKEEVDWGKARFWKIQYASITRDYKEIEKNLNTHYSCHK